MQCVFQITSFPPYFSHAGSCLPQRTSLAGSSACPASSRGFQMEIPGSIHKTFMTGWVEQHKATSSQLPASPCSWKGKLQIKACFRGSVSHFTLQWLPKPKLCGRWSKKGLRAFALTSLYSHELSAA